MLRDEIKKRQITFVGEEANHNEPSIAEQVCSDEGCLYANIEMPPNERQRRGIASHYNESEELPDSEKAKLNQEREDFMEERLTSDSLGQQNMLIICGSMHAPALSHLFQILGHRVEIEDLRNQG